MYFSYFQYFLYELWMLLAEYRLYGWLCVVCQPVKKSAGALTFNSPFNCPRLLPPPFIFVSGHIFLSLISSHHLPSPVIISATSLLLSFHFLSRCGFCHQPFIYPCLPSLLSLSCHFPPLLLLSPHVCTKEQRYIKFKLDGAKDFI